MTLNQNNEMEKIKTDTSQNLIARQKYEDFIHNSLVLPKKYYQLVEQNKQQNQDFHILKAKPVELKIQNKKRRIKKSDMS